MKDKNLHPIFAEIMDNFTGKEEQQEQTEKENVFEQLGEILNPDPIDRLFKIADDRTRILLKGYDELIDLLKTPGNIDKQTLMQSIGRTLKNASK